MGRVSFLDRVVTNGATFAGGGVASAVVGAAAIAGSQLIPLAYGMAEGMAGVEFALTQGVPQSFALAANFIGPYLPGIVAGGVAAGVSLAAVEKAVGGKLLNWSAKEALVSVFEKGRGMLRGRDEKPMIVPDRAEVRAADTPELTPAMEAEIAKYRARQTSTVANERVHDASMSRDFM